MTSVLWASFAWTPAQELSTVFSQLVAGGGWSCDFSVTNQGYDDAGNLLLQFFANDGTPLELSIDGDDPSSSLAFALPAGQTRTIKVTFDGDAKLGYAVLIWPNDTSVRATEIIRFEVGEQTQTQVGVPQAFPRSNFTMPVELRSSATVNTGVALSNGDFDLPVGPPAQAQTIIITLINKDGSVKDETTFDLVLQGHDSFFLDDPRIFPGLDDFEGSVSLSGPIPFGLLGLRFEEGILSSIAIDPGPVFAAFDMTDSLVPVEELEPNDSTLNAQELTLPARVDGSIEEEVATDVFKISCEESDIVTVYVLARGETDFDAFVDVELEDETLLAANDQNGLFGKNDAFVRMVIPEAGDYFIRVEDFFFGGGEGFDYTLVVKKEAPKE